MSRDWLTILMISKKLVITVVGPIESSIRASVRAVVEASSMSNIPGLMWERAARAIAPVADA